MRQRGQAVLETALVVPLIITLSLGAVEIARVADARSGLDAATAAAAGTAARAPSAAAAAAAAPIAFQAAVAAYPLQAPTLVLDTGAFARGGTVRATGAARVDLGFAPVPGLPRSLVLTSTAAARIESWRSR